MAFSLQILQTNSTAVNELVENSKVEDSNELVEDSKVINFGRVASVTLLIYRIHQEGSIFNAEDSKVIRVVSRSDLHVGN